MSPTVYCQGQAFHISTDMVLSILYSSANHWLEQSRRVCVCVNLITVCHRDKCSILALMLYNSSIHGCNSFQTQQIRDQRERDRAGGKTNTHGERERERESEKWGKKWRKRNKEIRKLGNRERRKKEVERKRRVVQQEDIMRWNGNIKKDNEKRLWVKKREGFNWASLGFNCCPEKPSFPISTLKITA